MPSKLAKVQKHVSKKKGSKINSLHENSRDAKRLRNAGARDDRVSRLGAVREKANRQWLERVFFFQDRLPDTLHPLDLESIQALITEYLKRNDEEIEQLKAERRVGRPPSTRFTILEQEKKVEGKEYESGFWVPNLQDEETLTRLDGWKGDWISLANLRFLRVDVGGMVKESQFPPRAFYGSRSPFFDAALNKCWKEGSDKKVALPQDQPHVVTLYIQQLYSGKIHITKTRTRDGLDKHENIPEYPLLAELLVFGERVQDAAFKNAVMDAFLARIIEPMDGLCSFPVTTTIDTIYKSTMSGSVARQLMVDVHVLFGYEHWITPRPEDHNKEFLMDLARGMMEARAEGNWQPIQNAALVMSVMDFDRYHQNSKAAKN
ncbi:hypothetical protein B0A55_05077 [Friedmanniomyces simplex]|uniref:BTB domain-containing protein n=1 Tax=Friedmanniomyces simplex TaxID=329884 RepID=A0A4U0XKJ5_9PEZI|nr:hypothetical protein B0A55_05077 [Friedmanniomyces simplex]